MSDIHRLLDEAFVGVDMTPELQDLKEELRGNLASRAAELQTRGMDGATAALTAVTEFGIPDLLAEWEPAGIARGASALTSNDLARLHRVKPKPAFTVYLTLLSALIALGVLVIVLFALRLLGQSPNAGIAAAIVLGIAVSGLVRTALLHETAERYAMPRPRAVGYGIAAAVLAVGMGFGALFVGHLDDSGLLVGAVLLVVAGGVTLIALGVTQTNRLKPWALAQVRQSQASDRFSQDPAAAARFGLYTVVIWTLAIAAFVVLTITIGFVWSWLALVGGVVAFVLVLSRMLFGAATPQENRAGDRQRT